MIRRYRLPLLGIQALALAACTTPAPRTSTASAPDERPVLTATVGEQRAGSPATVELGTPSRGSFGTPFVPGELIVGLTPGTAPPLELGVLGTATLADTARLAHTYALLRLAPGTDQAAAAAYLAKLPNVVSVDPNYRGSRLAATPPTNDPLLTSQWPYGADIADVYGAWAIIDALPASKVKGTTVAIIDDGVDPAHGDLNVLSGYSGVESLNFGSDVNTNSFEVTAAVQHGTSVAGVVGALKNNSRGAAGVAPGVGILPIKVFDAADVSTTMMWLRAMEIASYYNRSDSPYPNLQNRPGGKIHVLNMSLGLTSTVGRLGPFEVEVEALRQRGIVCVFAAGNGSADGRVLVPANTTGAIGVSCTALHLGFEMLAPYSSHGPEIWVSAPGNFIWSTKAKGSGPDDAGAYLLFNGTSSAAPFVAGVAALINAVYGSGGPDQDTAAWADKVKQRIASTADDLGSPGFDSIYGWGRVNARKAITGPLF